MATESQKEGKITRGTQHLLIDYDIREMGKKAAWSVSFCKPDNGVSALHDDNLYTYWQSDGVQPHFVNIQLQKKVKLQLVVLYMDFKLDESYTPTQISIRAGDGFHNLKEIKTVEVVKPAGWVYVSLSGNDPSCKIQYENRKFQDGGGSYQFGIKNVDRNIFSFYFKELPLKID